jgi:hypothetical protein
MTEMMGGFWGLLLVILALLAIAALIKYVFPQIWSPRYPVTCC